MLLQINGIALIAGDAKDCENFAHVAGMALDLNGEG